MRGVTCQQVCHQCLISYTVNSGSALNIECICHGSSLPAAPQHIGVCADTLQYKENIFPKGLCGVGESTKEHVVFTPLTE